MCFLPDWRSTNTDRFCLFDPIKLKWFLLGKNFSYSHHFSFLPIKIVKWKKKRKLIMIMLWSVLNCWINENKKKNMISFSKMILKSIFCLLFFLLSSFIIIIIIYIIITRKTEKKMELWWQIDEIMYEKGPKKERKKEKLKAIKFRFFSI